MDLKISLSGSLLFRQFNFNLPLITRKFLSSVIGFLFRNSTATVDKFQRYFSTDTITTQPTAFGWTSAKPFESEVGKFMTQFKEDEVRIDALPYSSSVKSIFLGSSILDAPYMKVNYTGNSFPGLLPDLEERIKK